MPAGLTRFSSSARKVLSLAHQEAARLNHDEIGPGHILIGLIQDEGEVGKILAGQGAKLDAVRQLVIDQTPESEKAGAPPGRIDLLDTTQKMLEQAVYLARQHPGGTIDSPHLLLALVELDDRRTQIILAQAGLERDKIREQVRQSLATHPPSSELVELLDTLEKLRHLLAAELTPIDALRLDRIAAVLREYFQK